MDSYAGLELHYKNDVKFGWNPSLSELIPIIFNVELTYLGSEASI